MSRVRRIDFSTLSAPERRADGSLVADAILTRTGVFTYRNADGTERREYRPAKSVFDAESLKSFQLVPITDDHPPEMLTAKNARQFSVGTVGESIRKDGNHIAARIVVHDAVTIAKMDGGKRAVSCGYDCDIDETPGTSPEGERYDAVQTNIVGNHLAIVHNARAGQAAAVRMDAAAMWTADDEPVPPLKTTHRKDSVMDLTQALAALATAQQALGAEKARADAADALAKTHKAELDKAQARVDSLTEELTVEKKARKDAVDATPAKVRARVDLETKAGPILGKEFKMDSLEDRAIQVAVIKHVTGVETPADKSLDYVAARFDAAVERAGTSEEVFQKAHAEINANRGAKNDGSTEADAGELAKAKHLKRKDSMFVKPGGFAAEGK